MRTSTLLSLQYMPPMIRAHEHLTKSLVHGTMHARACHNDSSTYHFVRGMYAKAYHYHDSSVCHPWWVTYMQEHITIMTPVYATHYEWHICKSIVLRLNTSHPWRVTCAHEHITMTLVYATHCEWHICKSILSSLRCMPPMTSDMYTRAYHHDFSICHPWRVTYIQEHITTSQVRATHGGWHVCKSTMPKKQFT